MRTLAREWADWCDFETITDPENLFVDPTYLVAVVDGKKPDVGSDDEGDRRFRCLVLEDADNYLHAEAGCREAAISRLLNTADGLVGNDHLLVLLTMNTPAHRLNPAILRPGRMFASIGFRRFGQTEARRWLGQQAAIPVGGISLAELLAVRGTWARSRANASRPWAGTCEEWRALIHWAAPTGESHPPGIIGANRRFHP